MKNYFVYGCELENEVEAFRSFEYELVFISLDKFISLKEATQEDKVIIYGSKDDIKELFEYSFIYGFSIAIVAKDSQRFLRDTFDIPKDPKEAIEVALNSTFKTIDLLYANDEIVLWGALVGEAPPHGTKSKSYLEDNPSNKFLTFLKAFKKILTLKNSKITITTHKEQKITTVASGIVIVEHDNHSCASKLLKDYISTSGGKVLSMLVSPSSVMEYLAYLYKAIFNKNQTMPKAVGIIQSETLLIESELPLNIQIDGDTTTTTPVEFTVHKKAIKLLASESFWEKESHRQVDEKEVIKLGSLPTSEEEIEYETKQIPLFTHADTSRYKELFANLREEARASSSFITLMILSTILATVGLFLNSSSVIIGAMLLAPLMQPIVSFSMGLLRFDYDLLLGGLKSVTIGIVLVFVASSLLSAFLPYENITNEIEGRLHPSTLDLIVALISGVAAAYVKNNQKITSSLAGVAIAVALVPPLAVAGIGIGWGDFYIFENAFLLFVTNFVGIVFAASITFVFLGYSPIKRAKNGLFISLVLVMIVSIPLYFSFSIMSKNYKSKKILTNAIYKINDRQIRLKNITISHGLKKEFIIRCDTLSTQKLSLNEKIELKNRISHDIEKYLDKERLVMECIERIRVD